MTMHVISYLSDSNKMSKTDQIKRKTTLHNQEIKCKNGCGFYGNPEWEGYCSYCFKKIDSKNTKQERSSKSSSKKVQRSHSDVQGSSSYKPLGFSKFEEKKKQQTEKRTKTIKSIIKRGHTLKESSANSPSHLHPIGETFILNKDLPLKENVLKDVMKQIHRQVDLMNKYYDKSIDEQSESMQDFYNFMFNRCETSPAYQGMSSEEIDLLMDKIEEQLMSYLHSNASQLISSEYEEKDLALQKRIRSLNWITPQHLGITITENSPDVRDLIDKAIADCIQMDSQIAPQQKIKCIVNCSGSIFNIIKLSQGVTASADEFLPALVYIVLKANPPLLQSNIKYITSYSIPTRLRSGEGAYYFTNLCCAVAFIEDLNAESLNMNEDEFQRYISGDIPLLHSENSFGCEGLRLMTQNLITLTEMQEKNNQTLNDMNNLRDDMLKFQETLQKCKPASSLIINPTPYTVPGDTDMSLIPEILRSRIVKGPKEDILIDIDFKGHSETTPNEEPCASIPPPPTLDLSEICSVQPANGLASLQSLQVLLPTPSSNSMVSSFTQQVVNIQDLEYPTELLPETKNEDSPVEFGPFESCDGPEEDCLVDPLSPESGFIEQNLHLPPPLQPVVVQSVNAETGDKK
ncbi:hypothetical protein JTE90_014477 [Oedothorax gibbosus]|uniref:Rab5 GDP/GTP exchange factor n=1 Tax=Oedothorax gibbosus TaxID=931172 RepID=A0AAV6VJF6_9ARAC|nr:hypothetical protein JTE90_014477 [Oedothorax gibbosus]